MGRMMPRRVRAVWSLQKYLVNSAESPPSAGLRSEVSSFGPRMYCSYRKSGEAVGVITTHIDEILGCGGPHLLPKAGFISEKRSRELEYTWTWNLPR